nr:MAG TPA: hypothetical protein [Caudoviricetes sp.]DAI58418.1 MAG TPA: hypothetical protein [Crassvirales sp.]
MQYGEYQATILSLNQSGCSGSGVPGIYHSPNTTAPILVYWLMRICLPLNKPKST